jgi:hypothetical protein
MFLVAAGGMQHPDMPPSFQVYSLSDGVTGCVPDFRVEREDCAPIHPGTMSGTFPRLILLSKLSSSHPNVPIACTFLAQRLAAVP